MYPRLLTLPRLRARGSLARPAHAAHLRLPARDRLRRGALGRLARGAPRQGLDAGARHGHGGLGADRGPVGAKLLLVLVDFQLLPAQPARALSHLPERRRLLRRPDRRRSRRVVVRRRHSLGGWRTADALAPGRRAGPGDRAARLLRRRLLLGQGHERCLGGHLHRRLRGAPGGHADGHAAASQPALRVVRGVPDLRVPALARCRASASTARSRSPTSRSTRPCASRSSSCAATPTAATGSAASSRPRRSSRSCCCWARPCCCRAASRAGPSGGRSRLTGGRGPRARRRGRRRPACGSTPGSRGGCPPSPAPACSR